MKPGKVLCYMFLFAILGVDRAQNLTKYNRWLRVFIQPTKRKKLGLLNSCMVYECKTKDVYGRGPCYINFGLFVCCFYVCRVS